MPDCMYHRDTDNFRNALLCGAGMSRNAHVLGNSQLELRIGTNFEGIRNSSCKLARISRGFATRVANWHEVRGDSQLELRIGLNSSIAYKSTVLDSGNLDAVVMSHHILKRCCATQYSTVHHNAAQLSRNVQAGSRRPPAHDIRAGCPVLTDKLSQRVTPMVGFYNSWAFRLLGLLGLFVF